MKASSISRISLVLAFALVASLWGCKEGGGNDCGPGTVEQDGECIPLCTGDEVWDPDTEACVTPEPCATGTTYNPATGLCEPDYDTICGPGTVLQGGHCVPEGTTECGPGTELDPTTGECIPVCVAGTHRDPTTGACIPDSALCISGQVWDPETETCVDVSDYCAEGTTWVASQGRCVPDDELLTADQTEGTGENDPSFGDETAYEDLTLPAEGESWTIGGTISTPADKNDDTILDADFDFFVFDVTGPTLLRIMADGVGGASSGFAVISMDEDLYFQRFGIGTTSDGALRDVFLPAAGTYAIVASDAMNFLSDVPFGGEGFGYFITIENLPIPTPSAMTFTDGTAETTGTWPIDAPVSGSMLGFYALALTAESLLDFTVASEDTSLYPALIGLAGDDSLLVLTDAFPAMYANSAATTAMLVADFVYWFGVADSEYTLTVNDMGAVSIGDSLDTTVDQPAWDYDDGTDYPWSFFTFTADAGDVVTLHVTTDSADAVFQALTNDFTVSLGSFEIGSDWGTDEGNIRFFAPYSGVYVLVSLSLEGADIDPFWGIIWSIPEHSYGVTFEIFRQTPQNLGRITAEFSATNVTVSEDEWEKFYLIVPNGGDSMWVEALGVDVFDAEVNVYDLEYIGPLYSTSTYLAPFAWRAPEAMPILVGVADTGAAAGAFDITITPMAIEDLGTLSESSPISSDAEPLATTEARRFFQFQADAPGEAAITVTPASGLDIVLIARGASLQYISDADDGGDGGAETLDLVVTSSRPTFFEVVTWDGNPPSAATTFDIDVTLDAYTTETEPNDDMAGADVVAAPDIIAAAMDTAGDYDWYAVAITGRAILTAETFAMPGADLIDTVLWIYDTDGTSVLATNDDKGTDYYSLAIADLPDAGTYFVVVGSFADADVGEYLLDINVALVTGESEPNDAYGQAQSVSPPISVLGAINPGGDQDWFAVTLSADDTIRAETMVSPGYTGMDTILYLYDTDGSTVLTSDDDGGSGTFSLYEHTVSAAGTYYVVVTGYSSSTVGNYMLQLDLNP
jgi:hypothetical protein